MPFYVSLRVVKEYKVENIFSQIQQFEHELYFKELITLFMNIQFPILKMLHFSDVLISNYVYLTLPDLYAWSNMLYF